MNRSKTFQRKIIYISIIALLLLPLAWLGQPSTVKDTGGKLAQMRDEYNLSESQLGDIDPAGETIKLASLGLRGVATNVLWNRAEEFKLKEDYDNFRITLDQLTKLQPHAIEAWKFQAHNLSYNISTEFDDYEKRYFWVKQGIDYLLNGVRYNNREPALFGELGRFFGSKIGKSDERKQFRRLFSQDTDFHETLPLDLENPKESVRDYKKEVDNWLVSWWWYLECQRLVDRGFLPSGKMQRPSLVHSNPSKARMNYAENIEEDGYFEPIDVKEAWKISSDAYTDFGNRELPATRGEYTIRLNDLEAKEKQLAKKSEEFKKMTGDIREQLHKQRKAKLTPQQRKALDTPSSGRSEKEHDLAREAEKIVKVSHSDVAAQAPESRRKQAQRLAVEIEALEQEINSIEFERTTNNYLYWKVRAKAEQSDAFIAARRHLYRALSRATDKNEISLAQRKADFESAFANWAKVFEDFPVMLEDPANDELAEATLKYQEVLEALGESFPEDFPLEYLFDRYPDILNPESER